MDGSDYQWSAVGNPCTSGDVEVSPGVVVASNVVLAAAPGSRLVIAPGACIGPGVVIQVQGGTLVIEANASLGSGVLVVGAGRIGAYTCIGSETTLINPQLPSHQVVAARSLTGDPSRRPSLAGPGDSGRTQEPDDAAHRPAPGVNSASSPPATASQNGHRPVYGRSQVDQLLASLFPHRAPLNGSSPRDGS